MRRSRRSWSGCWRREGSWKVFICGDVSHTTAIVWLSVYLAKGTANSAVLRGASNHSRAFLCGLRVTVFKMRGNRRDLWQMNTERRSLADMAGDFDVSAVLADDVVADGEAEAVSVFGEKAEGIERLEDVFEVFGGDAGAVVLDFDGRAAV